MNQSPHSALHDWHLQDARILLRADLNILHDGIIDPHDYRFQQLLPTLSLITQKGGSITIITHLGRPTQPDPLFSTRRLIPLFENNHMPVIFAHNPKEAAALGITNPKTIILMENLRFFPGEQKEDPSFAQELAALGDYFVNDAFGTLHRTDCSITQVPLLFSRHRRTFGLLVEHELAMLKKLIDEPARPYVIIIGGAKIKDKIPLLSQLLDKVDQIMLCPAIVFSFLKARQEPVGLSLVDTSVIPSCNDFLQKAAQLQKKVFFPRDYVVAKQSLHGDLSSVTADQFPSDGVGISIGQKTIAEWKPVLEKARTIFFNGFPGLENRPETLVGTQEILTAMAHSQAFTVVGGGDTVNMVQQLHYEKRIDFCSTGGGSTVAYLSGEPLPGLAALEKS